MKNILLFDNDGILVNTERYYFEASRQVLSSIGLTLTRELFVEYSLTQGVGVWNAFPQLTKVEVLSLRKERDQCYNSLLSTEPIAVDGVEEVLQDLMAREYRMAIVTSSLPHDFLTIHERTGFLKYFEFYLANGDYKASKPDPSPYLTALLRLKARAEHAVVIEDTLRGIRAGNSAGCYTVAIPNHLNSGLSSFEEADSELASIAALPALLESL